MTINNTTGFGFTFTSEEGHTYTPWTDGQAIGYKVTHGTTGEVKYLYLNPSSSDESGDATVFPYEGEHGDPALDEPACNHYFNPFLEGEAVPPSPAPSEQIVTRHTLTRAQAEHIKFYNGYGVPVQWFVGPQYDDGRVEVLGLGQYDPSDLDDSRQFVWSLMISADGSECHTSEAEIPDGFSTGITI